MLYDLDFARTRRLSDRLIRSREEKRSAFKAIEDLGLDAGLVLCLDAGDALSYDGTSDLWLDRTGGRYDFYRGADGTTDGTEPTFNGSAGGLSGAEYFSFDGGDYFTLAASNPAWVDNLHKNNAIFSFVCWLYLGATIANQNIFGTGGSTTSAGHGIELRTTGSAAFSLLVDHAGGSGDRTLAQNTTATVTANAWNFLGMSINEATGAGGIVWNLNGAMETDTSTYSSPSSSAASYTAQIGTVGNAAGPLTSGGRIAMISMWSGVALSAQSLAVIRQSTRGRFGV